MVVEYRRTAGVVPGRGGPGLPRIKGSDGTEVREVVQGVGRYRLEDRSERPPVMRLPRLDARFALSNTPDYDTARGDWRISRIRLLVRVGS
jgi:hypothetical protein